MWVSGPFLIEVSLRNRTAKRRGRQNACVWQTWQCYYVRVLSWSSLTLMFSGLLQKDLFKGGWSSAKRFIKQNYCHASHTGFTVVFPLPSCCVSSLECLPRRRRQQKCHLKSEFELFQSSSRLLQLADVVKCGPILPRVHFLGITSEFRKTGRKFRRRGRNFLRQTWNQAFSRRSRPITANVEVVFFLINPLALLTCSLPSPRPLNMHLAFTERASETYIVDLCIFRVILDEQVLLLDNFTRNNNYLRSVPLE